MSGFNMDDYVPVNERIEAFYKQHPDGSLQSEIVEHTETRVTVKAYAYRDRDDTRPGTGLSSETIPGSTSFTKGSEVENAETSAWGRAIAALGFEVKRGIASREEMRRQQPGRSERTPAAGRRSGQQSATTSAPAQYRRAELAALAHEKQLAASDLERYAAIVGIKTGDRATDKQMDALIDAVRGHGVDGAIESAGSLPAEEEASVKTPAPVAADAPPPEPGTPEYGALKPADKAAARAYWSDKPKPEQMEAIPA